MLTPGLGDALSVVGDAAQRESAKPGRQRVVAPVVGDAESAHESDGNIPDVEAVTLNLDGQGFARDMRGQRGQWLCFGRG